MLEGPSGEKLLIDPFLQHNPKCPPAWRQPRDLDALAVTHGHFDHVGDAPAVVQSAQPSAVVAIVEVAHWLRRQGVPGEIVVEMNKGGTVEAAGMRITMVDANHSAGIADGEAMLYGGEPAGLVVTFSNGARVYHAGDTNVFSDMALIGELYRPDVALLPIGDHYTMGPYEAAKACELLGVERVVPMHYGTWPILVGSPEALRNACRERGLTVQVIEMQPGETLS